MIGLGKLGFPVALAINDEGHEVFAYDINPDVKEWLKGNYPYREEDIEEWIDGNTVVLHDSIEAVVADSEIVFVAIQTPHKPEYEGDDILPPDRIDFDYSYLCTALAEIFRVCKTREKHTVVAVISTCLPGTFEREIQPHLNEYVRYAYTPQFIAMGTVLRDYLDPEFNLIGVVDDSAADALFRFYETINSAPPVFTDVTTAEGIKVSYNTWITAKTVIANAWGEMCTRMGMDFDDMKYAWDLSTKRLRSNRYTAAGMSDGGGCHPRDNIALSWLADTVGMSHNIWDDLMTARQDYEAWHAFIAAEAAEENDLPLVLLGRAFKPETDIETGSPAKLVANILIRRGVQFLHVDDLDFLPAAVYFIGTQHARYVEYDWPAGSIIFDPFGYIPDSQVANVIRLGRS